MPQFLYNGNLPFQDNRRAYVEFMEKEMFVNDIGSFIKRQQYNNELALQRLSQDQREAIEEATRFVSGTNAAGFKYIGDQLQGLETGLDVMSRQLISLDQELRQTTSAVIDLGVLLDLKTDILISEHVRTNKLLEEIKTLLKIPETQKQKNYHITRALTFYQKAYNDGFQSPYYRHAFNELIKAQEFEENDCHINYQYGLIHMNSKEFLNIEEAIEFFLLALEYAEIFKDKEIHKNTLKRLANCFSILGEMKTAIDYQTRLYQAYPDDTIYLYDLIRLCVAGGYDIEAVFYFELLIEKNRNYIFQVVNDVSIISCKAIQKYLKETYEIYQKILEETIDRLKETMAIKKTATPELIRHLEELESLYNEQNLLATIKAQDLLEEDFLWNIPFYKVKDSVKELTKEELSFSNYLKQLLHTESRRFYQLETQYYQMADVSTAIIHREIKEKESLEYFQKLIKRKNEQVEEKRLKRMYGRTTGISILLIGLVILLGYYLNLIVSAYEINWNYHPNYLRLFFYLVINLFFLGLIIMGIYHLGKQETIKKLSNSEENIDKVYFKNAITPALYSLIPITLLTILAIELDYLDLGYWEGINHIIKNLFRD